MKENTLCWVVLAEDCFWSISRSTYLNLYCIRNTKKSSLLLLTLLLDIQVYIIDVTFIKLYLIYFIIVTLSKNGDLFE